MLEQAHGLESFYWSLIMLLERGIIVVERAAPCSTIDFILLVASSEQPYSHVVPRSRHVSYTLSEASNAHVYHFIMRSKP